MKRNTKRSLLFSLLSLLLSCSMLIGTTFAWFTDSVTSANNKIVAGNLDVEMQYYDGTKWVDVKKDTNVFDKDALWEPGHTEVVYLKIFNDGSLAFDYQLGVNIVEETLSESVLGGELRLSDHIVMGAVEGKEPAYADRAEARKALDGKEVKAIREGYAASGTLYSKTDTAGKTPTEAYLALVVYMPETVGNEANYKLGAAIPSVTLGLNLLATQETYEKDSFGDQYDKDAISTAPSVPVEETTVPEVSIFDPFGAGQTSVTLQNVTLDVYDFNASNYSNVYSVDEYKDWICDFYVSTDKEIYADTANSKGLMLLGNYGSFGWLGFWAPASTAPYDPTPLLGSVGAGFTYEAICTGVQEFRCGLIDEGGLNAGTNVTVELRMTNPNDATDIISVAKITVTL